MYWNLEFEIIIYLKKSFYTFANTEKILLLVLYYESTTA